MYLIYILRRDLRLSDNVILHALQHHPRFTHLLPLYIFPPSQIEVSGFLKQGEHSPYPEARSRLGKFWRCGSHRARFLAEGLWDFKTGLEKLGSGLVMRVGHMDEVMSAFLEEFSGKIGGVWMTRDWASEELQQEQDIRGVVQRLGDGKIEWKVWDGEEMLIHDDDLPVRPADLPDVFTSFRKAVEPLRQSVRPPLPRPTSLPPLPPSIPLQGDPFIIPSSFEDLSEVLQKPLTSDLTLAIEMPVVAKSAHPFRGGETQGHSRVQHLLSSGAILSYKDTRNGLLGRDFSTKLAAYLAHGFVSSRQIHEWMTQFEDGEPNPCMGPFDNAPGYGRGENKGTSAVRFELLWRDYMRLCMRKYGDGLFSLYGYRGKQTRRTDLKHLVKKSTGEEPTWKSLASAQEEFRRFQNGTTGTGLIDASMRELYLTGYTSNRARQNCASFLSKWLDIDWRLGAEWYESMLVDYDVASNWGNWQYVAGVGNDPRENIGRRKGTGKAGRRFNPVKQGYDYDPKGEYVRTWVTELHDIGDTADNIEVLMSPWRIKEKLTGEAAGATKQVMETLAGINWIANPLVRIIYKKRALT